jgi:4-amino-4-deoxy-L-arabinose transferase-like glycosyltransferase
VTHPSSRARAPRSEVVTLAALTAAGLALRLAFVAMADRDDLGFNDQFLYHHMADGLAHGRGYRIFDSTTLRWPPAFPFLLSLVYRATSVDVTMALLMNAVLSTLSIPLVHWCARPWAGARAAALAAAAVALLPGQWLFAGTILTEPLAALQILLVVGLVVRHPPGWRIAIVLGGLVGWSALTRGEGALLGLVVIVGWAVKAPWRRIVAPVAITAAVAVAVLLPWVVRNSRLTGEPTGVSLNVAETLYAGHNPKADGGATYATRDVFLQADPAPSGPEREVAQAELLQRLAFEWAREHPGEELALIPKRLLHLAEGDGNVVSIWIDASDEDPLGGAREPLIALADVTWFALLGAFVVTLVVRRRHLPREWIVPVLTLPALSLVLYGVVLYGNFRYRVPYEPLLVLVIAVGWARGRQASPR